jgi:SAM-dependent methyltransferase
MSIEYFKTCKLCNSTQLNRLDDSCNICQCSSCGYIFDNPHPSFDEIRDYYSRSEKYDGWLQALALREKLWKKRLNIMRKWKKYGSLLDVGTGIGQFLHIGKDEFTETFGTEISESAIHIAKEIYGLDIFQGSLEEIDFANKKFDNITMFHVLEHVEDPRAMIRKCRALLNDGGMLFIAVPNDVQSIKAKGKDFFRKTGIYRPSSKGIYGLPKITLDGSLGEIHISHFTPDVLGSILKREGFSILEFSLDPYFISRGVIRRNVRGIYYLAQRLFFSITGRNLYDTIWVVATIRPDHDNALSQ